MRPLDRPLKPNSAQDRPGPPPPRERPAAPAQHAHLLVVAADAAWTEAVRAGLRLAGYSVDVVDSRAAALAAAQAQPPDLAIIAGPLPGAQGGDDARGAAQALKAAAGDAHLPVLLAAPRLPDDEALAGDVDVDDLLALPVSLPELLARVRAQLHLQRLHQAQADSAQEMSATLAAAHQAASQGHAAFEQNPEALLLALAPEGVIVQANACALALSGSDAGMLVGEPLARLCPSGETWAADALALRGGAVFSDHHALLQTAQGSVVPVEVRSASLALDGDWETGAPALRVLSLRDRRPELARTDAARQEAQAAATSALTQAVNSALFIIASNVEMLQAALLNEDSAVQVKLSRIADATQRIAQATTELVSPEPPASPPGLSPAPSPCLPMLRGGKSSLCP